MAGRVGNTDKKRPTVAAHFHDTLGEKATGRSTRHARSETPRSIHLDCVYASAATTSLDANHSMVMLSMYIDISSSDGDGKESAGMAKLEDPQERVGAKNRIKLCE